MGLINLPVILVLLCMLLCCAARPSPPVNAIMVMIKVGVLLLFIVIGVSAFQADHFANFRGRLRRRSAAAGTIFSFIGWMVATAGEEVKNPRRPAARDHRRAADRIDLRALAFAGLSAKSRRSSTEASEAGLAQILNDITGTTVWGTILPLER